MLLLPVLQRQVCRRRRRRLPTTSATATAAAAAAAATAPAALRRRLLRQQRQLLLLLPFLALLIRLRSDPVLILIRETPTREPSLTDSVASARARGNPTSASVAERQVS